jgi:hypothetical protein
MAFPANSRPRAVLSISGTTRSSKKLARATRATMQANKVPPPPRDMQLPILQQIVEVLKDRRERVLSTTGNRVRGLFQSISSEHIRHFPWLTRHMVNHYIATHPYGQTIGRVIVTHTNNQTVVSGLTDSLPVMRGGGGAGVRELQPQQMPSPTGASNVSTTTTEATDPT